MRKLTGSGTTSGMRCSDFVLTGCGCDPLRYTGELTTLEQVVRAKERFAHSL